VYKRQANILGGRPVAVPRISFAHPRPRHQGVSHHTLTALGQVALREAVIALPELDNTQQRDLIKKQLEQAGIFDRHRVVFRDGSPALGYLSEMGIRVSSMGRKPSTDPAFFLAAGAAGSIAADLCK